MKSRNKQVLFLLVILFAFGAPTVITNAQDDCDPTPVVLPAVQVSFPAEIEPDQVEINFNFCLPADADLTVKVKTPAGEKIIVYNREPTPAGDTYITATVAIPNFHEGNNYKLILKAYDNFGTQIAKGKTTFQGSYPDVNTCVDGLQQEPPIIRHLVQTGGFVEVNILAHVLWNNTELAFYALIEGADISDGITRDEVKLLKGDYAQGKSVSQLFSLEFPFDGLTTDPLPEIVVGCVMPPESQILGTEFFLLTAPGVIALPPAA